MIRWILWKGEGLVTRNDHSYKSENDSRAYLQNAEK